MPPPHPHPHPLHGHTHMELMGAISMDGMKEYAYFLIRIMGLVIRSLSSRDAMRKQFTVFFFQPWKQETMGTKSTHQSHPTTSPKVPRPTPECHITSGLTDSIGRSNVILRFLQTRHTPIIAKEKGYDQHKP